jgi:hypothetical protein
MMRFKKALVVLALLFAGTAQTFAQPGDPETDPDDPVPITGIEWLIAGGCALGLRKLLSAKKSAVEE